MTQRVKVFWDMGQQDSRQFEKEVGSYLDDCDKNGLKYDVVYAPIVQHNYYYMSAVVTLLVNDK